MVAIAFYDVVLWVHVAAVVIAFGGVFTYPVWFALVSGAAPEQRALFHRAQVRIGRYVISPFLLLVILAGAYLATDADAWSEVWVSVPLVIALVIGGLGGAFFAPRERRLAELAEQGGGPEYDRVLGQVRTVSYVAMGLVLLAAFFMVTKLGA